MYTHLITIEVVFDYEYICHQIKKTKKQQQQQQHEALTNMPYRP